MERVIIEEQKAAQEPKWKFRKLVGKDLFLMLPLIKKIGINKLQKCWNGDIVKDIVASKGSEAYEKQVEAATYGAMLELGQVLIEGLDTCENEIFNLLSKTSNLSRREVENLGFSELPAMIIDFVKKDEFKDFLTVAQQYIK
jgi:hypothetical protein